jgi:hypothetical protein
MVRSPLQAQAASGNARGRTVGMHIAGSRIRRFGIDDRSVSHHVASAIDRRRALKVGG